MLALCCVGDCEYSTRYPHQTRLCASRSRPTAPSIRRDASDADIRHSIHSYQRSTVPEVHMPQPYAARVQPHLPGYKLYPGGILSFVRTLCRTLLCLIFQFLILSQKPWKCSLPDQRLALRMGNHPFVALQQEFPFLVNRFRPLLKRCVGSSRKNYDILKSLI